MILDCPACSTRYDIYPAALGPGGRMVRCFNCGHTWHAFPEEEREEGIVRAEALAAAALVAIPPDEAAAEDGEANAPDDIQKRLQGALEDVPLAMPGADALDEEPAPAGESAAAEIDALDDDDEFAPLMEEELEPVAEVFQSDLHQGSGYIGWVVLTVIVLAVIGSGAFARKQIVELWPPAAKLYAMLALPVGSIGSGLNLRSIASERMESDVGEVLIVRGSVFNVSGSKRNVPNVKLTLFDAEEKELQSAVFAPQRPTMLAGEDMTMRMQLVNPALEATRLEVTFTEEQVTADAKSTPPVATRPVPTQPMRAPTQPAAPAGATAKTPQ